MLISVQSTFTSKPQQGQILHRSHQETPLVSLTNKKAFAETQTLRAAYAGGVRPSSLYQI